MNIGFITRNYPPITEGGAEMSLYYLANALAERGHGIKVFLPSLSIKKVEVSGKNPKVYRFPWVSKRPFFLNNPIAQLNFRKYFLQTDENLDIIDAYNFITALPMLSLDLHIPYVVSLRDATPLCDVRMELFPKYHPLLDYFKFRFDHLGYTPQQLLYGFLGYYLNEKRLNVIRKASYVTYCSHALMDLFKDYNPNGEVVYSVAPRDVKKAKKAKIEGLNFSRKKVFLYAGRLSEGKGSKMFFEAACEITKKRKDLAFVFAGEGIYFQYFKENLVKDSIYVIGKQSNETVLSLMSQSYATVIPSIIFEPFPRVALESLAFGTPLIGTNSGGIPEAIEKAGVITQTNKASFIEGLIKMSDEQNLYKDAKKETYEQVGKFSKKRITDNVISVYEKVLR